MNDWIVDTSVMVKWVLNEPDSTVALRVVTDVLVSGGHLAVLDIAQIEAANVLWGRLHRGLITTVDAKSALAYLKTAPVQVVTALPLLDEAFDIAAKYGVAVYDAVFVAAARGLGRKGVTADEPLVRAVAASCPKIKLLHNW